MDSIDLVFSSSPLTGSPLNLVFGETDAPTTPPVTAEGGGNITGLRLGMRAFLGVSASGGGQITGLRWQFSTRYDVNASRPTVAQVEALYQEATPLQSPTTGHYQQSGLLSTGGLSWYQESTKLQASLRGVWQQATRITNAVVAAAQQAQRLSATTGLQKYEEALKLQSASLHRFEESLPLRGLWPLLQRYEQALRLSTSSYHQYEEARKVSKEFLGLGRDATVLGSWSTPRYQEAWPPRPGASDTSPPDPEPIDPCYLPVNPAPLVFKDASYIPLDPFSLLFVCERHSNPPIDPLIVIPALRTYFIVNTVTFKRVSDNVPITIKSASVGTDESSWGWTLTAALPFSELEKVEPTSDGVVEVELVINGVAFRFLVEDYDDNQVFPTQTFAIRGRSVTAYLDSPYAPLRSWVQDEELTSRQIAEAELIRPGLETGFSLDWTLINPLGWNMPAGSWSFNDMSPIAVIKAIAEGGGGFVNSHPYLREILVKPMYQIPFWEWMDNTDEPRIVIPRHFLKGQSLKWTEKPAYNGVRVSGTYTGVTGLYKRTGSAGDFRAAPITSPFITHPDAARNVGRNVLSAAGKQARVNLGMPLDPEYGLMPPGTFVEIVNGGVGTMPAWRGLVRSTEISAQWGTDFTVQQTVGVERHYGE